MLLLQLKICLFQRNTMQSFSIFFGVSQTRDLQNLESQFPEFLNSENFHPLKVSAFRQCHFFKLLQEKMSVAT